MSAEHDSIAPVSYKPSVYYFRKALRETTDPAELRRLGLTLCRAYELEREWIRDHGMIPPKMVVLQAEAQDKGWDTDPVEPEDPNQIHFPFGS